MTATSIIFKRYMKIDKKVNFWELQNIYLWNVLISMSKTWLQIVCSKYSEESIK